MAPKKRYELLDDLWKIQRSYGYISNDQVKKLTAEFGISSIELEGVISFYHFFSRKPSAKYVIYLNNSIISIFSGYSKVKRAFERATGTVFGQQSLTGLFELHECSCVGLSDCEPAALINFKPFIDLNAEKVHQIILDLKSGANVNDICDHPESNVHHLPNEEKTIFLRSYAAGTAITKLKTLSSDDIIKMIQDGNLRGMGGAFFPTYIKWQGCKDHESDQKYIVCNADEGEPGTFKDRILLQKYPGLILEGMISAGFAVGATKGVIYLRAEYWYLKDNIEQTIDEFKRLGYLGTNVVGINEFDFDIRIQMGAGAYVCGEETALLQSMEGYRGEPRPKVFLPVEKGFLGKPTLVNNVETFCGAARIIELGPAVIQTTGTRDSIGTKLISISGDCKKSGIYEIEWGITVRELLDLCGAENTRAVQVSGPSGEIISEKEFDRKISLNDLRCGGSFMIFNNERNLLEIVKNFNQFFIDESCGVCTPCRAGNYILARELNKIGRGLLDRNDLDKIIQWSKIMRYSSRCGLGQTAPNSIIQSLEKFPELFEPYIAPDSGLNKYFDMDEAVKDYDDAVSKHNQV